MRDISQSVKKRDHAGKMDGSALYVGDYPASETLHGVIVRSKLAHAKIVAIHYPKLPEGYFTVDSSDIAGDNRVHNVPDNLSVFAAGEVRYIGDHIAMIVGSDARLARDLAAAVVVDYQELPAVFSIEESDHLFYEFNYGRGDIDDAFARADKVYEESFRTSYQEQGYLEPQGMMGHFDGELLTVRGALQCPYYVHSSVVISSGLAPDKVRVIQEVTGGGFGGKEAYPCILGAQVGVAAMKAKGRSVRVVFSRREDMEFSSKRQPSHTNIRLAVKDGKVSALDIDFRLKSGAYFLPSLAVLQRGMFAAPGVYLVPNLRVNGKAYRTNTVPAGAFRGFGAPQAFFPIEMMMTHVAKDLGVEPLDFKKQHLAAQGDLTSTSGEYHFPVPLPAMLDKLDAASGYYQKRTQYARSNQGESKQGRYRRGIGSSLWFHGAGFSGAAERDILKAVVSLSKDASGQVEILVANTDIGQGTKTTFSKIVANELGLPYEQIICENPNTARVADSGPTVASRSLMTVGELLRRAAVRLRTEWLDGQAQLITERYVEPDFKIPFDVQELRGDSYPTYSWGVAAVELELDTLTGSNRILGAWAVFDVGTPMDLNIVVGQMEGGVLQGLGYASMEQMYTDSEGRIRNNSYSDYLLPTARDVTKLDVQMHVEEFPFGPYGAKGAGELPLVGLPAAVIMAIEQCLGNRTLHHIPFTAEDAISMLYGDNAEDGAEGSARGKAEAENES
jgi:CO/xanthine dehydrogenase Mo-binding subunit